MLRDGAIVHDAHNVTFWNWQFGSDFLNIAVLAALSTVLAYQLNAACCNIILGTKAKERATACDIHKVFLSQSASPFEIFAAVVRVDVIDGLRLRRDRQKNVRIVRRSTSVRTRSILSLALLVLAAPTFTLISIFIVLQRNEQLTFSEAKFGGVALGVGVDNITYSSFADSCDLISLRIRGPANSLVQFMLCFDFEISRENLNSDQIRLSAETTFDGQIKVSALSLPSKHALSMANHLDMIVEKQLFRIQPVLSLTDAAQLIHDGQAKLAEFCDSAKKQKSPHDEGLLNIENSDGLIRVSKDFECSLRNQGDYMNVVHYNMGKRITPIEHDKMTVVNVEKIGREAKSLPEYIDVGGLPFLVQRSRYVNVLPLFMITLLSLVFRILTEWGFNNDVEEGVQAIVRHRLGVTPEEPLLRSSRTLTYNCSCQDHLDYVRLTGPCNRSKLTLQEESQSRSDTEIDSEEASPTSKVSDEW